MKCYMGATSICEKLSLCDVGQRYVEAGRCFPFPIRLFYRLDRNMMMTSIIALH